MDSNGASCEPPVSADRCLGAAAVRNLALRGYDAARASDNKLKQAEALLRLGDSFAPMVEPGSALPLIRHAQKIFMANALSPKAGACSVVAAYALYDLGEESNAILNAESALVQSTLPLRYRVAAIVVSALAHARLGDFDLGVDLLRGSALPLVEAAGQGELRSFTLGALAVISLGALISRAEPEFWTRSDASPANTSARLQLAGIMELLEAATVSAPTPHHATYIEIAFLLVRGLYGPSSVPADALTAMAAASAVDDPPLAGWALYCKALVLRKRGELSEALTELDRAEVIARDAQQLVMLRDITWQRAGIREQLTDLQGALRAYKQFSAMRLRSALQTEHPALFASTATEPPDPASEQSASADPYMRVLEPACVRRAAQYIDQHLSQRLRVGDIAAHCEVSRRTLEVAFKTTRCETVAEYTRRKRLEHAMEILRLTNTAVSDVAKAVGFSSTYLFNAAFVTMFGVSPKTWRQSEGFRQDGPAAD